MRRLLYTLFFVAVFLGVVLWQTPLSFALSRVNVSTYGLSWEQAEGRVLNGRVSGLVLGQQFIGDAYLKLVPARLLRRQISYDIIWRGPPGHGTGQVVIGNADVSLLDLRSEFDLSAINGLSDQMRQIGGTGIIQAEEIKFSNGQCHTAVGQVSTNILSQAAAGFGREWPDLSGEVSCEDGMLVFQLDAVAPTSETIDVRIELGLTAPSFLEARIAGSDAELEAALAIMGFWQDNGVLVYRREAVTPMRIQ